MSTITTIAGIAGRIAGTTARGLIWAYHEIDWAEVAQIIIEGLKVLIVLTLLAGRYSRRAWDHLPVLSERLGRWYAGLLVPSAAIAPAAAPVAPLQHRLATITATLAAAQEALERLVQRLYPVLDHTSSSATSATSAS